MQEHFYESGSCVPKSCAILGVHPTNWEQLGNKTPGLDATFGFGLPQRQSNHQAFGGSVWESNPPFDPRRTESPALKAGKVTGLFSPPGAEYHEDKELIARRKPSAVPQSAPVLLWGYSRFGKRPRANSKSRDA